MDLHTYDYQQRVRLDKTCVLIMVYQVFNGYECLFSKRPLYNDVELISFMIFPSTESFKNVVAWE